MRSFIRYSIALVILIALGALSHVPCLYPTPHAQARSEPQLDLLILHGKLVDGSGKKPRTADVGIRGDRIVFVGDARKANLTAERIVDATGLVVSPGFIDPHTHTLGDLSDQNRKSNEAYLMQGVTTVVTGNDGGSVLNIGETLKKWDEQGIGTNAILLAGFGTIRGRVLGPTDAQPNAAQLEEMKALVARAMDEGAFGLSTGLYYAPQSYAKTEEVIELSKVAASKGGIYDTHMRSESAGLLDSIAETIRIGREAKIPVHISHIKALGPEVWHRSAQAIKMIKQARAAGIDASACQYPYTASGTSLQAALVPRWAEVGGRRELLKRIDDPQIRPRLIKEMEENLKGRGGADSLLIADSPNGEFVGKRLDAIAKDMNKTPVEAALELIKLGSSGVISFNMNEKDIQRFMKEKFVTTCSDGSTGHPRKYGTFTRKLREYVYNQKLISLPFAVRNSSALTAETFRIPERGLIREGYFADVIVFDEKTVADRATYEQPELFSVGMKFVIVNGKIAVENGAYIGALAGRALRTQIKSRGSGSADSPVEISGEPRHHPKFENEFVRIWDVTVPPGDVTLWHVHRNDNVVVTFGDASLRIETVGAAPAESQLKFGDVGFRKATYVHRAINIGTTPFHNFTIEILKSPPGPQSLSPRTGQTSRQPILENERVRVYRLSLAPGESTEIHTHLLSGLGVAITTGEIEVITEGRDKPDRLKLPAGDLRWRAGAVTHSIKNVGKTRFEAIDIELK
ncbi:MAG TPA: amidohydrolase family protein [Pyrinomonadaceae bacterium]|nr:amidohydrolase family protein [Pyrinomonadaceae bacterium]